MVIHRAGQFNLDLSEIPGGAPAALEPWLLFWSPHQIGGLPNIYLSKLQPIKRKSRTRSIFDRSSHPNNYYHWRRLKRELCIKSHTAANKSIMSGFILKDCIHNISAKKSLLQTVSVSIRLSCFFLSAAKASERFNYRHWTYHTCNKITRCYLALHSTRL